MARVRPTYVQAFSRWVEDAVQRHDVRPCSATGSLRRSARAPTDEHFLPLFFALGAAPQGCTQYLSREVMYGMLAMDAFALQPVV
jgi:4,5-DOPA dioxygenase extradiol